MEILDFLEMLMHGPAGIAEAIAVLPIIMAAIAGASAIAGGVTSSTQNRKSRNLINARNDELVKEQYQGVLDDAGSKAYLNVLQENLRKSIDGMENSAVSTGATHENLTASKESANRSVSEAISSLLQREDQKKAGIIQQRTGLLGTQIGMNAQNAQNWAQVAGNVASAAGMLGSTYLEDNSKLFGNNNPVKPITSLDDVAPDITRYA